MKSLKMKRIVSVIVVVSMLASPLWARPWSFRSGGAPIEAELVDVKDGNAVLKKDDGSQISVPLNKLSLADVRYVNEVLKSAEAAVAGGDKPAAEAPSVEAPRAEPAPKALKSADLSTLHYEWKKGKTYVYHVRILGERGHDIENRSGEVTCKVKSIRHDEITLTMTCQMKRETSTYARRYVLIPGRHVEFFSDIEGKREITITIDPTGRLLESKGEAPLPYLLGDLSELIVEPLPPAKKDSWTIRGDPGVAVISPFYPYCRYSLAGFREGVPAEEKTTYKVRGRDGALITLSKRYEMIAAAAVAGRPRIEATGEGTLTFDTERHMFASLDYNMRVTVRDSNKTEEVPLRITYHLLSESDIAEMQQEVETEKAEAEKARKEKARPLTKTEIDQAVADLCSEDPERIGKCATMLAEKKKQRPNAKIAKALEALMLGDESATVRADAARAMKNWATEENVPALIKAINDKWPPVGDGAIEALCRFSPAQAINPVAQRLAQRRGRGPAAEFLKAMGPDAEDAVLHVIENSQDAWVRSGAIEVLGDIGTKKSLPTLEKAVADDNWMVNGSARKALAAIKARL